MGRRRCERGHGEFEDMNQNRSNGCHRGANSLMGFIFAIVSFGITLAFKIVGVVFQAFFGVLSGIGSGSRNAQSAGENNNRPWDEKQAASYTVSNDKQEPGNDAKSNVRDFKKPDESKAKAEAKATETEDKNNNEEVRNKDFYVVLFILTMIPAIVALSMGKLLYAGYIGAAGFGLMILAGFISRIMGSFKKRADVQKEEVFEEESEKNETIEKLIKEAFNKLFEIRKDIDKVKDAGIRAEIEAICCTGEKIIGEVRTNPEGLTHVRKFFYYYLDAFGEIVSKYLRLSSFEESSEEVGKLVAETERSFADIDGIFKDLCNKLLEKDMMNLKAEINVIKNSN